MKDRFPLAKKPKLPDDRLHALGWLSRHGHNTPDFGTIAQLAECHDMGSSDVVVWLPSGSRLLKLAEAYEQHRQSYGVMYVGQKGTFSASTKFVQIGPSAIWIDYLGFSGWRSNWGHYETKVAKMICDTFHPDISIPFFSIDYVFSDAIYAIDMDIDPHLGGTCLKDILTRKAATRLIRRGVKHFEGDTCSS